MRKRAAPAAPRYLSGVISRGDLVETVRATGTVEPVLEVQVGAQISGRVTHVAVDFNSHVHAGDLLAELDATPYRAQLAQAQAALASARAVLAQRRADLTLAERNLARGRERHRPMGERRRTVAPRGRRGPEVRCRCGSGPR